MNNYLKIQLTNSLPIVEINYDSIESFQNLMFCLISDSGFNLIYSTIEKQLIESNKTEEIKILNLLIDLIMENKQKAKIENPNVINPSSFK